ncbi:hypothetical protein ONB71_02270 [Candidatus Purcelliella pentastirinorum]|uniref:ATP synthase F1 complex delta/epsilon subunit N-terminal domain-containing protein n=1 Tax=Candidatus Purcelliella pentastirinorum TaxID=472834 RepID=A0AAX3N7D0_9ENTR|nr:hypothetical protein [Candidatus Purcelliella pentastirinorum]WDI78507.1 hypothetical protein ONB71_02270 [Candidatus Purcelliella pentastirinorum]WDR80464.1 hypothetical protein ONB70_02055 [Candidatus Purcelliella pentastirinorum]
MLNLNIFGFENNFSFNNILKIYVMSFYGELCIYPNHSPLLVYVKSGIVLYDNKKQFFISKSLLEIKKNIVTVFTDIIKYDFNINIFSIKFFCK